MLPALQAIFENHSQQQWLFLLKCLCVTDALLLCLGMVAQMDIFEASRIALRLLDPGGCWMIEENPLTSGH